MLLQHPYVIQGRRLQHRTMPYTPLCLSVTGINDGVDNPILEAVFQWGGNWVVPCVSIIASRRSGTGATPYWQTFPIVPGLVRLRDVNGANGITYPVRGFTTNASGASTWSAPANGTAANGARPGRVENLTAVWNGTAVTIRFYDVSANESNPGFALERADDGGGFTLVTNIPRRSSVGYVNYVDSTVTGNHSYQYRVRTFNGALVAPYSATVTVSTVTPLVTPAVPLSVDISLSNQFQTDGHFVATENFSLYVMASLGTTLIVGMGNDPGNENGAFMAGTADGITFASIVTSILNEQGVHDLQVQGSELWVCGTDPMEDWSLGNIYSYTVAGGWTKFRTLPNVIHALGLWHDGTNIWVAVGAHTGDNVTWKGRILKSTDSGQTWTAVDVNNYRMYDVIGFDSHLYAVGYNWTGSAYTRDLHVSTDGEAWTVVPGVTPATDPRLILFNSELVGVQSSFAGIYSVAAGGAVTLHTLPATIVNEWNVLAEDGTHLYVLATDGTVWRSTVNLDTWEAYTYVPNAVAIYWWTGHGLMVVDKGLSARVWQA